MSKPKRVIQVPIDEDLLARLDELSRETGDSRSSVIREACAVYITAREKEELVRQYVASYREFPESAQDDEWRTKLVAESWQHLEPWDDEER